jgi:hypothetical protein
VSGSPASFVGGRRNVHVTYVAGRASIPEQPPSAPPADCPLAVQTELQGQRPANQGPRRSRYTPGGFAVPKAVVELCGATCASRGWPDAAGVSQTWDALSPPAAEPCSTTGQDTGRRAGDPGDYQPGLIVALAGCVHRHATTGGHEPQRDKRIEIDVVISSVRRTAALKRSHPAIDARVGRGRHDRGRTSGQPQRAARRRLLQRVSATSPA